MFKVKAETKTVAEKSPEAKTEAPTFKLIKPVMDGAVAESKGYASLIQALTSAKNENYGDLQRSYYIGKFVAYLFPEHKGLVTEKHILEASVVLDRKGHKDGGDDTRRTLAQEQLYGAARVAWKRACDKVGIAPLDNRGAGSKGRKPRPASEPSAQSADKAPVARMPVVSREVSEYEFALQLATTAGKYIAVRGVNFRGEWADIIRHFVEDVAKAKSMTMAANAA
jgi:hypothetical protein